MAGISRYAVPMALFAMPGLLAPAAFAQDVPAVPDTPAATGDEGASDPAAAAPEPGGPPQRFDIQALDVYGVQSLPASVIEEIVYAHIGPDKSVADVEAAGKAIEQAYAERGFGGVFAYIPEQDTELFRQGIVRIDVTESRVGEVRVVNARDEAAPVPGSPALVQRQLPSLASGAPFRQGALESELEAANRFPGRTVNVSPKPGAQPGTIDVDLLVERENPLSVSAELNNDNSVDTTRLRAAGNVRYANLWGRGHSASLGFVVAPEDPSESTAITGSYTLPFLGSRWSLSLIGFYSDSNVTSAGVTATGTGPNVLSDGYQVGLRAIYAIPSKGSLFQTLSFGADFKNFNQNIRLGDTLLSDAPVRYVPIELQYAVAGGRGDSLFDASVGATYGLRAIKDIGSCLDGSGQEVPGSLCDAISARTPFARENFFRLNFAGNYTRTFGGGFRGLVGLSGQWADSTLVSNEQFSVGGASSVRGYFLSEAVGDIGAQGALELQSPSLGRVFGDFVSELRLIAFADAGYVYTLDAAAEQDNDSALVGLGGGVRLELFRMISGEAMLGFPMTDGPNSVKGDPRFTFVVRGEF